MPYGTRDGRVGMGVRPGTVLRPLSEVPADCTCDWRVHAEGPGGDCIMRLNYEHSLCARSFEHERDRQASLKAAETTSGPEVA